MGIEWQYLAKVLATHNDCSTRTEEWRTKLTTKVHQKDSCNIAIRHNHLIVHRQHVESITKNIVECARDHFWLQRIELVNQHNTIQHATTDACYG